MLNLGKILVSQTMCWYILKVEGTWVINFSEIRQISGTMKPSGSIFPPCWIVGKCHFYEPVIEILRLMRCVVTLCWPIVELQPPNVTFFECICTHSQLSCPPEVSTIMIPASKSMLDMTWKAQLFTLALSSFGSRNEAGVCFWWNQLSTNKFSVLSLQG